MSVYPYPKPKKGVKVDKHGKPMGGKMPMKPTMSDKEMQGMMSDFMRGTMPIIGGKRRATRGR